MPVAATAPWLNHTPAWGRHSEGTRRLAVNTALSDAVETSSSCYRQSMAVPTGSVATTAGTPKTIFCSSTAPTNDSSKLSHVSATLTDRSAHSSPHAHSKSQNLIQAGGGWRWRRACRGVVCPEMAWRHYSPSCPHPFRPFCVSAAYPSALLYISSTRPHPATPADSLAYTIPPSGGPIV